MIWYFLSFFSYHIEVQVHTDSKLSDQVWDLVLPNALQVDKNRSVLTIVCISTTTPVFSCWINKGHWGLCSAEPDLKKTTFKCLFYLKFLVCSISFRVTVVWSAVTPLLWSRVWHDTTLAARWGLRWPVITVPSDWPFSTSAACFYTPESTRSEAWSCSVRIWSWNLYPWSRWSANLKPPLSVSDLAFLFFVEFFLIP